MSDSRFITIREALDEGAHILWFATLRAAYFDEAGTAYYWREDVHPPKRETCQHIYGEVGKPGWRFCTFAKDGESSWCSKHRKENTRAWVEIPKGGRTVRAARKPQDPSSRLTLADLGLDRGAESVRTSERSQHPDPEKSSDPGHAASSSRPDEA